MQSLYLQLGKSDLRNKNKYFSSNSLDSFYPWTGPWIGPANFNPWIGFPNSVRFLVGVRPKPSISS